MILMSDTFFQELEIPKPNYHLECNNLTHGRMTGTMLIEIEKILIKEKPKYIVVYGDCNTTLAASLAAVKLNVPIIHIEAGMRSFNKSMPEEINRTLVDHIATLHMCATEESVKNLKNEGILDNVYYAGDLMVELLRSIRASLQIYTTGYKYILLTIHRQSNTKPSTLRYILDEIGKLDNQILFPAHPRTIKIIKNNSIKIGSNIKIVEPMSYHNLMQSVANSTLVITDSGGLQKEAYELRKFCIVLREETEWNNILETGWLKLLNPLTDNLSENINILINNFNSLKPVWMDIFPYNVANTIVDHIINK